MAIILYESLGMAVDYGTFVGNGMSAQLRSNANDADELPRWTSIRNMVRKTKDFQTSKKLS